MPLQKKEVVTNYIFKEFLMLSILVALFSCSSQKSGDESKVDQPFLDGVPANFDGLWNGHCSSRSHDGKDDFDGSIIFTIRQTDTGIDIAGACYKEKPAGQYFKTNKLTIDGNDLIDERTGVNKGKIGSSALSYKSSLTSADAPGASIESTINIQVQAQNQIGFEYFQDGENTSARMRALTITGSAKRQ
jgi:hypothetical protein